MSGRSSKRFECAAGLFRTLATEPTEVSDSLAGFNLKAADFNVVAFSN
jgi:hypothetical protein